MISADEVNRRVFDDLLMDPREPFFAFIHYCDPHEPYLEHGGSPCPVDIRTGTRTLATIDINRDIAVSFKMMLKPGMNPLRLSGEREFRLRGLDAHPRPVGFREIHGEGWKHEIRSTSTKDAEIALFSESDQPMDASVTCILSMVLTPEESQRNYAHEVEYVDGEIGKLVHTLQEKGLLDRTFLILTSDHGESLGEHDHFGHVDQLYDPLIHVPLIFCFPSESGKGICVEGLAALSDIAPTLWDLLGIKVPIQPRGTSLLPEIHGMPKDTHRAILLGTYAPEAFLDLAGVRTESRKYIRTIKTGAEEIYNLKTDLGEIDNIAGKEVFTAQQLSSLLVPWTGDFTPEEAVPENGEANLDESTTQMLKGLGYFR